MFGLLCGLLVASVLWAVFPTFEGGKVYMPPLWGTLPCIAGLAAVVIQWMSHPDGVKDFVQGGVCDVSQADSERVAWTDWAIFMTRRGEVDRRTGQVRLVRSLFFGLIPLGTVLRPLGEFYRVEVKVDERTSTRKRRSFGFELGHETVTVGYTYSVNLVDRRGDRLCVLDIGTGLTGPGERFVGELRNKLE